MLGAPPDLVQAMAEGLIGNQFDRDSMRDIEYDRYWAFGNGPGEYWLVGDWSDVTDAVAKRLRKTYLYFESWEEVQIAMDKMLEEG